jgi:hypothetical protein
MNHIKYTKLKSRRIYKKEIWGYHRIADDTNLLGGYAMLTGKWLQILWRICDS